MVGHEDILQGFDAMIRGERLAHAYLLVGPTGVGKGAIASWVAARLLCQGNGKLSTLNSQFSTSPCGACPACVQVAAGTHPDVLRCTVEGALTIDAVRAWTTSLTRTSLLGGWRVGIVEGAETMSEEAANACLKAIEEPPPHTIVCFTAPSRRAVIPTIASRCVLVPCRRVATSVVAAALVARGVAASDADALALEADGCPGVALTWATDPEIRAAAEERLALATRVLRGSYVERLQCIDAFIAKLPEDRGVARAHIMDLLHAFRALARGLADRAVGRGDTPLGAGIRVALPDLVAWMAVVSRASKELAANVAPRLVFEGIALSFP